MVYPQHSALPSTLSSSTLKFVEFARPVDGPRGVCRKFHRFKQIKPDPWYSENGSST